MRRNINNQRGQVALIMVLIITVVGAIVVSFAGRVTSETRMQSILTDSSSAFLTAQSGLEEAMKKQTSVTNLDLSGKSYNVNLSEVGKDALVANEVSPGTAVEVVLTGGVGLTGVRVLWSSLTSKKATILVSVVGASSTRDFAYDTEGNNGFTKVTEGAAQEIAIGPTDNLVRVTVFGGAARVIVEPVGGLFPAQTLKYQSSGAVGLGNKQTVYGLEYEESKVNRLPEIFDYALFSYGSIIQ